jgi:hypothetical protein
MLVVSGQTIEGQNVYAGVWSLHATHGIPLDVIFQKIEGVVDWVDFFKCAAADGVNHNRLKRTVGDIIHDVYGREFKAGWDEKMEWLDQ